MPIVDVPRDVVFVVRTVVAVDTLVLRIAMDVLDVCKNTSVTRVRLPALRTAEFDVSIACFTFIRPTSEVNAMFLFCDFYALRTVQLYRSVSACK